MYYAVLEGKQGKDIKGELLLTIVLILQLDANSSISDDNYFRSLW